MALRSRWSASTWRGLVVTSAELPKNLGSTAPDPNTAQVQLARVSSLLQIPHGRVDPNRDAGAAPNVAATSREPLLRAALGRPSPAGGGAVGASSLFNLAQAFAGVSPLHAAAGTETGTIRDAAWAHAGPVGNVGDGIVLRLASCEQERTPHDEPGAQPQALQSRTSASCGSICDA